MTTPPTPTEWTTQTLAAYLEVTELTLYTWRRDGKGPDWYKRPNGRVRYRPDAVTEWLEREGRQVA